MQTQHTDTDNFFCLATDGLIWSLGNHGDIEAAKDTAASIGIDAVYIAGEDTAARWLETLQSFLA